MSDSYENVLFLEEPEAVATFQEVDATPEATPRQVVFIRVAFETEGFGTFTAGGFNTAQGATSASFVGGRLIPLKARPERGHRFDHWEFRNGAGSSVFGGTNPLASVLPRLGLILRAFFKAEAADTELGASETVTLIDADGSGSTQAGPEVFVPGEGVWAGIEAPLAAERSRAAKIKCESTVGDLPKTLCIGQPQRMESTHRVIVENATDFAIEGTLVGVLEIPGFGVKSEKEEKIRVAPRTSRTFELKNGGTLKPNKTGSFSIGAITTFKGPAATPAAASRGFEVKVC